MFTLSSQRVANVAKVTTDRVQVPMKCYNAGPTFSLPCIYGDDLSTRSVIPMIWGLKPWFKTDFHLTTNNARTESITTSKLYSPLLDKQRCVLVVDGFYEWKTEGASKRPFLITNEPSTSVKDDKANGEYLPENVQPLLMAGLYDAYSGEHSFTVLTMESTGKMAEIHERMPLFLNQDDISTWLDISQPYEKIAKPLLAKSSDLAEHLKFMEVSSTVNSIRNQSVDCVIPKKEADDKLFSQGLGRFFTKKRKQVDYMRLCRKFKVTKK